MCLTCRQEEERKEIFILRVLDEISRIINYQEEMGASIRFDGGCYPARWTRPTDEEIFDALGQTSSCISKSYPGSESILSGSFGDFDKGYDHDEEIPAETVARVIVEMAAELLEVICIKHNLPILLFGDFEIFGSRRFCFFLLEAVFELFSFLLLGKA